MSGEFSFDLYVGRVDDSSSTLYFAEISSDGGPIRTINVFGERVSGATGGTLSMIALGVNDYRSHDGRLSVTMSNTVTSLRIIASSNDLPEYQTVGLTFFDPGSFPNTNLNSLFVDFNYATDTWRVPNVSTVGIRGLGPIGLTFGSKLTTITDLPYNLTSLDLSACTGLTSLDLSKYELIPTVILPPTLRTYAPPRGNTGLPTLPTGLEVLDLSKSLNITTLANLPDTLKGIKFSPAIKEISFLPFSLETLDISESPEITRLPQILPAFLKKLVTSAGVTGLPVNLPNTLKVLDISRSPNIIQLPEIPFGLTSLSTSAGITGLPVNLPGTLKVLDISRSPKIVRLPDLDSGLTGLSTSAGITGLPTTLPFLLETLDISQSSKISVLPGLPSTITRLSTSAGNTGLPTLPTGLVYLDISQSSKITTLPTLPNTLTHLSTSAGLTVLPSLPTGLTGLFLSASTKLKLTSLNLSGNTGLTSLTVPSSLTSLNITGCTGLTKLKLDPAIVKTAVFTRSGITKPPVLLLPSNCNYTFI